MPFDDRIEPVTHSVPSFLNIQLTMIDQIGSKETLKVAIIGAGPAGLGAAIELSKRPFIDWTLYEKKPVISEISNGLSIQRNTWRMLELMGAAQHIKAQDFFRPANGQHTQHR